MDWENHLEKESDSKKRKKRKNQSEIAACEQKTTSEKANFCSNTVLPPFFKIRAKNLTPQNNSKKPRATQYSSTQLTAIKKIRKSQNQQLEKKSFERAIWHPNIAGRLPENSRDRRLWRYMN